MKQCLYVLILLIGTTYQLARAFTLDEPIASLIEHTPLDAAPWQTSATIEDDLGISQVWFARRDAQAILVLPRAQPAPALKSPWGEMLHAQANHALLVIKAKSPQTWVLSKFGGDVQVSATRFTLSYTASNVRDTENNYFALRSSQQLHIAGKYRAQLNIDGVITDIIGRGSKVDELYGPDEDNTWKIKAGGGGSLQAKSWLSAINFDGFETLIGSDNDDQFVLVDGVLNTIIEGAGGHNEIIFQQAKEHAAAHSEGQPCPACTRENDIRITFVSDDASKYVYPVHSTETQQEAPENETLAVSIKGPAIGLHAADAPLPSGLMGMAIAFGLLASFVSQAPVLLGAVR